MARKGSWVVLAASYESDAEFRDAVRAELADLESMMYRLGDGFVVAAIRVDDGHGYETIGVAFEKQFMPAAKRAADRELTEDEIAEHFPEPEQAEV